VLANRVENQRHDKSFEMGGELGRGEKKDQLGPAGKISKMRGRSGRGTSVLAGYEVLRQRCDSGEKKGLREKRERVQKTQEEKNH